LREPIVRLCLIGDIQGGICRRLLKGVGGTLAESSKDTGRGVTVAATGLIGVVAGIAFAAGVFKYLNWQNAGILVGGVLGLTLVAAAFFVVAGAIWPEIVRAGKWFVNEENQERLLRFAGALILAVNLFYLALRLTGVCGPGISTVSFGDFEDLAKFVRWLSDHRFSIDVAAAALAVPATIVVIPRTAAPKPKRKVEFSPVLIDRLASPITFKDAVPYRLKPTGQDLLSGSAAEYPHRIVPVPTQYKQARAPIEKSKTVFAVKSIALGLTEGHRYEPSQISDIFRHLRRTYPSQFRYVLVLKRDPRRSEASPFMDSTLELLGGFSGSVTVAAAATDEPVAALPAERFEQLFEKGDCFDPRVLIDAVDVGDTDRLAALGFALHDVLDKTSLFEAIREVVQASAGQAMVLQRIARGNVRGERCFLGIIHLSELYEQLLRASERSGQPK
jgi:hypothetical protein